MGVDPIYVLVDLDALISNSAVIQVHFIFRRLQVLAQSYGFHAVVLIEQVLQVTAIQI